MTRKRYDPNDEDQIAQRQKEQALRAQQRKADWEWFCADPRGRRILAEMLQDWRLFQMSHVPGDPLTTAFNEGMRACALATNAAITNTSQEALSEVLKGLTEANG